MSAWIELVGVAAFGVAVPVTAGTIVQRSRQSIVDHAVCFRLHFLGTVDAKGVEQVLAGVTGWRPPRWRPWAIPTVVFELLATEAGIEHRVLVPRSWVPSFRGLVGTHLEGVHLELEGEQRELVEGGAPRGRAAASYQLNTGQRPLRTEPVAQARTLIASVQHLEPESRVVLQWLVSPRSPVPSPSTVNDSGSARPVDVAALRQKLAAPVLGAVVRICAKAPTVGAAQSLLRQVEASLHLSNNPGAHFHRASVPTSAVAGRLTRRHVPLAPALVINTSEIVGLLGFPMGSAPVPGMHRAGCRPLAPSAALPTVGTVVGDADTAGQQRPVALEVQARYRHVLVTGPTGTGKTTLLTRMVEADLAAGHAVLVIDAKGDLVDAVLERVPAGRRDDVVLLDPTDVGRPVGFNPLRHGGLDPELAVEQAIAVMSRVWSANWGVRTDDVLRAGLRTLIADPDASLADIGPLLTDTSFRARLVARCTDPTLVGFWASFEALSDAEQAQWAGPVLNKWRAVFSRPSLRRVLGQPHPPFDLAAALDTRGVVLAPLAAGLLGTEAAGLFGSFLMGAVWGLVQARAARPAAERRPLMVYVDELARVAALPVPLDELLAQARSFNVGVTVATQHLTQLPSDLRQAVLANPRSKVAFQPGHDDAQVLAREFGLGLTADDLKGLAAHQAVAQLYAAGRTQPTCTIQTRPVPAPECDPRELRRSSAERWGSDGAAVDAWLMGRMNPQRPARGPRKPPGTKPRSDR